LRPRADKQRGRGHLGWNFLRAHVQEVSINCRSGRLSPSYMPRKRRVSCVACGRALRGRPVSMRLKITHSQHKLLEAARGLGFTSLSWNIGDVMEAPMHRRCFDFAIRVWRLAFVTRALSPRRQSGEPAHPPHVG